MRGNCRAAPASARGTGRTAYTKDVRRTNHGLRGRTLSMKLRVPARSVFEYTLVAASRCCQT
jgi:hypothetical protein